jgi:hypothetical protein
MKKPDKLHSNYFMKVELIDTLHPNKGGLDAMISCAEFYKDFLQTKTIEIGDELYDTESYSGIEFKVPYGN